MAWASSRHPLDRFRVRAQADAHVAAAGDRRDPQRVAVGGLGDRAEALDRPAVHGERGAGARDVGDREAELARAGGDPLDRTIDVVKARQGVKELVQLLGVAQLLAPLGLGVDALEAQHGVGLTQGEVDVEERVAVAELGRRLAAMVQAHRDLGPQPRQPARAARQPVAQASRDAGEEDVVDRHVAGTGLADRPQLGERDGGEGELPARADPLGERGAARAVTELAPDRARQPRQLAEARLVLRGCRRAGGRGLRLGRLAGVLVPQHLGEEAHARDPVGHRVMDADDDQLAPVVERPDQVDRPQGARVVEALGHDLRGRGPRPVLVDPGGALATADVGGDVELIVGHPARVGRPARAELDAVAAARALRQPSVDRSAQPLEVERLGRRLEHEHLQRVAGDRRRFQRQDVRVVRTQALHAVNLAPAIASRFTRPPKMRGSHGPEPTKEEKCRTPLTGSRC